MANKVIQTILERTSVREYNSKKVPLSKVKLITDAGKMAPNALNKQQSFITVVRSKAKVEKLRALGISEMHRDVYYGATTLVLVHAPKDYPFAFQDCSLILGNMFIAAASLKIGSCWINQSDELLSTKEGLKLKKKLEIPEDHRIVGTCILGYTDKENQVKPRKENFVKIK